MNIFFSYVPFQYLFLFTKAIFFILAIKVLDPSLYSDLVKSNIVVAYVSFIGFGINNSIALFSNHKNMQKYIDLVSRYAYILGLFLSTSVIYVWTQNLGISIFTGSIYLLTNLSHNFKQKLNHYFASISFILLSLLYFLIYLFFYFNLEQFVSFTVFLSLIISIIFLLRTTKFKKITFFKKVLKHGINRGMPLFLNGFFYQGLISFDLILVSFIYDEFFYIYAFYQSLFVAILGFTNILSEYIFISLCKYESLSELKSRAEKSFLILALARIFIFIVVLIFSGFIFDLFFKEISSYKTIFFIFWASFLVQTLGIGGGALANILGKGWLYTKIILYCALINLVTNSVIYLLGLNFVYYAFSAFISFFCLGVMSFVLYNSLIKKI